MKSGLKSLKRAPKKKLPASSPVTTTREDDQLCAGDVVMLPDGAVAAIEKIVGADAYVVEWQKQLGRGPWIYPLADLVPVT